MIKFFKCAAAIGLLGLGATTAAHDANISRPAAALERLLAAKPLLIEEAETSARRFSVDHTAAFAPSDIDGGEITVEQALK